jgi:hypothetical protein
MPDPTISNATTVAPAANAAPAIAAPAPSVPATPPNLSGLQQPGVGVNAAPAPGMPTPTMSDVEGQYAEAQKDYQAAQKITQQPTTQPPVPHARLLAMVTGLARGLSAFGESLATRGKEGGAPQVEQEYAQDQELQLQKNQAARENQARQAQLQIVAGDNAMKMGQMYTYLMTLPDDVEAHHVAAISATTDAAQKAYNLGMTTGDFSQYNSLQKPPQGSAPVTGAPPQATQSWKTAGDAAALAFPKDPVILAQQKILQDPKSTPQQMAIAANTATQRAQEMGAAAETAGKVAATAPIGQARADQLNQGMQQWWNVLNPGQPLPAEFQVTATSTPQDIQRIDGLMNHTEQAAATKTQRDLANQMHEQTIQAQLGNTPILGDASKTGAAYLASLPASEQGTIRAIGEGRQQLTPYMLARPIGLRLQKEVAQAYPDYDFSKAPAYLKTREEFTSGKIGTGINSYNTAIAHLGTMYDTAKGASLADLNNPASPVRQKLQQDENFVSSELAKAVANGQMTEGEKDQMLASINGSVLGVHTSGKYLVQIQNAVQLLLGKLTAYQNQWNTGMPSNAIPPIPIIDPQSQATLQRLGGGGTQNPQNSNQPKSKDPFFNQ